eukprot:1157246-Pelagomonas_calceolata.AAC.1
MACAHFTPTPSQVHMMTRPDRSIGCHNASKKASLIFGLGSGLGARAGDPGSVLQLLTGCGRTASGQQMTTTASRISRTSATVVRASGCLCCRTPGAFQTVCLRKKRKWKMDEGDDE